MNEFKPDEASKNRWDKLTDYLGEKLQLGLLEKLKRVKCYQFEADTLTIEPFNQKDFEYFNQQSTLSQLHIYIQDSGAAKELVIMPGA